MKKNRTIYIIPGFGESTHTKNYREIIKDAKNFGLKVVPVKVRWELGDFSKMISQVDSQIPDNINGAYILGFSFGAYIASILAKNKKAKGYIFCSLSPYFKDDLKNIPQEAKDYFGKEMMSSFKKFGFPKKNEGQAWFLVGDKDWPLAIDRTKKSFELWNANKELKIIKGVGHELGHQNFVKAVRQILKKL